MNSTALGTSAIIAGALVPLVSRLKQPSWGYQANFMIAFGIAFLCAVIGSLIDGNVNTWQEFVASLGAAVAASQTIYAMYFANTELEVKLAAK